MLSLNLQPAEKPVKGPGDYLDVIEVFKTIQGEGPLAGMPAVFVRLAGCDLTCPACDTNYTKGRRETFTPLLAEECVRLANEMQTKLVVITGGEPFRQNITPLCNQLVDYHLVVQIETNGTLYPGEDFPWQWVVTVCSPKTPRIHPDMEAMVDDWKYVVRAGEVSPEDGLPTKTLGNAYGVARPARRAPDVDIYVQPLDEGDPVQNALNTQAAVKSCMTFGYRLCLQTHKIAGLP
jgi:7-carboxy-7-deazaguanine synthase